MAIPLIIIIFLVRIYGVLWMLYLPSISINEKQFLHNKNSYGARLTMFREHLIIIFLIPQSLIGGHNTVIYTTPFMFVLGVTMLSCTS